VFCVTGRTAFAVRWLLLCALSFGVIGMHHLGSMTHHGEHSSPMTTVVAAGPDPVGTVAAAVAPAGCCDEHTGSDGHGAPGPTGVQGLLHLCLAVLVGAIVLGAMLMRWRRTSRALGLPRQLVPALRRRTPRAPPDSATVLASLGVLRL